MAPLTRGRADADGTPTDIMAVYYAQRASAGLFNGMHDSDPVATFTHGARELSRQGIAYLHVIEGPPGHAFGSDGPSVHREFGQLKMSWSLSAADTGPGM